MAERDNRGRFAEGNPGGPGRPKRQHEEAVLDALRGSFPPERLISILEDALLITQSQNSARGMLSIVEFISGYALGKPIARVERAGGNAIEEAMVRWKEMQQQTEQQ